MTTYRVLLVITAACSALITAVLINPANSNGYIEPVQNFLPPALMQAPDTSDNEVIENAEPLTLALKICTRFKCEYLDLSDTENYLIVENESPSESSQYQTTVPLQLPQRGVPIIEM